MSPKPNLKVSEPLAGYEQVGNQKAKAPVARSSVKPAAFLREALDDLTELDEYAEELDMPPPSQVAKESARAFVEKAVREVPRPYTVSPWDDGKVIVSTLGAKGFAVSIYFNAKGGASCYVVFPTRPKNDKNAVRHYSQAGRVANKWVFDSLRNLGS